MKKILFFMALLFIVPSHGSATEIYVQSIKAPIKVSPSFSAKTVWTAKRGDKLDCNTQKGDWYLAETGNKKGWISSLLVSNQPPIDKISRLVKTDTKKLSRSARRRPSSYTTAAAARGLSEERARKGKTRYKANYLDLDRIEAYRVDQVQLSAFLDEGGLQ